MMLAGARLLLPPLPLLVLSCGPSVVPGSDAGAAPEACAGEHPRCAGGVHQACVGGELVDLEACQVPDVCVPELGCRACDPRSPRACVDGHVVACGADGTLGDVLEDCGELGCGSGVCGGGDCGAAAKTIYVVTSDDELMSFDPAMDAHAFTRIGRLDCPAGLEWPERGTDPASPYSMAVGRDGSAWVLYTSGELFEVSTADASCRPTSFAPGLGGFKLFGMGFVADAAGAADEQLLIAGGSVEMPGHGHLARLAGDHASVELRGALVRREFAPELTGTGDGELWAYYPGQQGSFVARLDPHTAQIVSQAPMPPLTGVPVGWAFAHWGGRFYVFISDLQLTTGVTDHRVMRLDPDTGAVDVVRSGLDFKVVGAGVSTCAPIVID